MDFSLFGSQFAGKSGILELMDDLGKALSGTEKKYMLGGGNPAHIPQVNALWRKRLLEILSNDGEWEAMLANYDPPQGHPAFLEALAGLLRREFGWAVGPENIAVTHGSQNGFFLLFNFLAGRFTDGSDRKILFPIAPEYIGYADQALGRGHFSSHKPLIQELEPPFFKYRVDFDGLRIASDTGALCVSRPTNPTGNVLTDEEIRRLAALAEEAGLPLIIDNAYGAPFPGILFEDIQPFWNDNIILSLSLSKLGLPATRTGMIVARRELIEAVSAGTAVLNLANGGIGQVITRPMIEDGSILALSREVIRPFYLQRRNETLQALSAAFGGRFPYRVHKPEGALFLWLWFPLLKISSRELYERLKKRHVLIVSGHHFFFGLDADWPHSLQCIRINASREPEEVARGLEIIAEEVESQC